MAFFLFLAYKKGLNAIFLPYNHVKHHHQS